MKIIGKNSLSQYVSYLLFVLFILFTVQFVYEIIGFAVSYYNLKTGNQILSDFFIIGKDVGWNKNQWTIKMDDLLKFKFFIPFTEQNLLTGVFTLGQVLSNIIRGIFFVLFFYSSYKFLKEISKETVFNIDALTWLKRFGWLNIIFAVASILISLLYTHNIFAMMYSVISFIFFGGMILFIVEFFKKGLELQDQVDLTI
jgi:hypothetical protein